MAPPALGLGLPSPFSSSSSPSLSFSFMSADAGGVRTMAMRGCGVASAHFEASASCSGVSQLGQGVIPLPRLVRCGRLVLCDQF